MAMASDVPRFCVLGGGVAGLVSARLLQRQLPHAQITVLEESERLGGLVQTARGPKGQILEQGFHSSILVNRNGREALGLAKMLKLEEDVQGANIEASARRHLLHRGRVQLAPAAHHVLVYGPALMAEPLWPRGRQSDESVAAFTSRRGSRSLARHLADPICRGQLAGKAEELSVRTCFPRLWHNEQRFGSVFVGAALGALSSYRQRSWMALDLLPELEALTMASFLPHIAATDVRAHSFARIAPNAVSTHTRKPRFIRAEDCRHGMFNVTLLCGAARLWPERKMFSRSRRVLSETFDEHAAAVRSWLDKLVIGMNLCPWAGKTDESGGIRVVTSLGSAPSEVLEDLQREASALPCEPDARPGAATTSLVVCPHVKAWQVQF
ncbi:PPOX [Symbiodinium sp. KB8]|nr:PPOX [Symbiodinium sp. KB8]